jgi:molybdopterin converting factor subunit 1
MKVTVKLFAAVRDLVDQCEVMLELEDHATLEMLRAKMSEKYPPLRPLLPQTLFAVNAQYVPDSTPLEENSDIALIPPVSGG